MRPAPLIDAEAFEPPARLGRRIGGVFVAVGEPLETIPVCDLRRGAEMCAWAAAEFERAPAVIHAIDPTPATRGDLVRRLRAERPNQLVVWLPRPMLTLVAWVAAAAQRVLRPGRPVIDLRGLFYGPAGKPANPERG